MIFRGQILWNIEKNWNDVLFPLQMTRFVQLNILYTSFECFWRAQARWEFSDVTDFTIQITARSMNSKLYIRFFSQKAKCFVLISNLFKKIHENRQSILRLNRIFHRTAVYLDLTYSKNRKQNDRLSIACMYQCHHQLIIIYIEADSRSVSVFGRKDYHLTAVRSQSVCIQFLIQMAKKCKTQ